MKISFNPSNSNKNILDLIKNNKDIIFDLKGHSIFARGVEFKGTDTNTWRDIKINNVSIGSHTLDLRNGSNTTLTNTNGVVTINSTWRPVVDNLTSDSTTSSLSAKQGKVLKALIDGKSNSDHNHDDRYLKLTGGTIAGNALITFADSGSWSTDKRPQGARGGLCWTGQSDYAKLYAEETVVDNLDLVIQFGDDNSNGLSIRNKANTQTSYISSSGVITTGTFKGNLDWSYITNKPATATRWPSWAEVTGKPSSFTPSTHTHGLSNSVFFLNMPSINGNAKWKEVFGYPVNYNLLLSVRINNPAPEWCVGNFGSGILYGGSDTKGFMSSAYNEPFIMWAGGNGSSDDSVPKWYIGIKGTHKSIYNLATIASEANAAYNLRHSHANKSVLDGITSALVNSWNTAYNFVSNITGTDTDKVINKWEEIVNFLAGITEDNKLNTLLNSKLSIQQLSAKDILTTKTNNALFWVDTKGNASTITTGPFTDHPYALLSVTNYNQNAENYKFFYRSRLAFSSAGDIKVASCHHENEYQQDETWYNVLTSKNSGINGSTIKLNGTSITVYSSGTADGRYVKKSGDTMSGDINFGGDNKIYWGRNTDSASISFKNDGDGDANSYMSFITSDNGNEYFRWSHSSGSTNTEWMALRSDGLRVRGTKVSLEGHTHDDRYYTKAESNAKYITDITTSVNKLTFTRNGSNIIRDITVNVVHSQGYLTNIPNKDATTKASPGLLIYNSYEQTIGTNSYSSVLSINTGGTIQIAGNWGDDQARNLYWRSQSDRNVADYPWKSWRTILDSENYSSTLDSRYYTESEVNSLLSRKLDRVNLTTGNWNPRGWNLAADYHYNGGDLSISENNGKMYVSVDGCFWQNEGQYRVLDTSDIGDIRNSVTLHQYLSATDVTWYPLVWGGNSHNNTSDSTGAVYKSYDKLSWQTSSQTLYATNIQTNNIKNLSIGGGIYWNSYVESASDGSDAASITLVRSGVAGGTTLVLSQMNDTNDTIQFKTNTAARLYHNSYPILTTQNTYVSNNKGYINGTEITQVNNADTLDGYHESSFLRYRGSYKDGSVTKDGVGVYGWDNNNINFHERYGDIINIQGHSTWRTRFDIGTSGRIRIVHGINTTTATEVGYLAYLHDNVASATKLQTPRTIWGQSFDGTGNVSGSLSEVGNINFKVDNSYDIGSNAAASRYIYTHWLGARSGRKLELGANNSGFGQGLCIDTNLNVGIGTNTPAYKLDVKGDIYTTTGFKKNGSSDSYVLLGGGGHKLESSLNVDYKYLTGITLTGGDSNNTGYRLIFEKTMGGWTINYGVWAIAFRHSGRGTLNIGFDTTNSDGSTYIYDIRFLGSTVSRESTPFRAFYNSTTKVFRIYWYYYDYTSGDIAVLRGNMIPHNGTWMTSLPNDVGTELAITCNMADQATNADTVDGYHATDGRTFNGNINWGSWNDAWSDGTHTHPWYGFDHRYPNTGAYSTTITDYYGMTIKTYNTLLLDCGTLLLNSRDNVGIGTTSPTQKLDVIGNIRATGQIIREGHSNIWVYGRNTALLRETSAVGYHALWSLKTTNGSWDFGEYNVGSDWNNIPVLSYITDSNYNSGNNATTYQIKFPLASGTVALTSNIPNPTNYYWANVKISASSSTTTSPTVSNLTATNSIRMSNILLEHTDEINNSANGGIHLNYRNSGNVSLCYGGGNVGIGTTTPSYKLDVNGQMRASGFHHASVNSDNYMLLAGGGYKTLKDFIFLNKSYNYTDHEHYNLTFHKLSGICNNLVWVDGHVKGSIAKFFVIDPAVFPYRYDEDPNLNTIYLMSGNNYITINAIGIVTINNATDHEQRVGFFYTGRA